MSSDKEESQSDNDNKVTVQLPVDNRKAITVLLLCYEKNNEEVNYGSISGKVWLKSSDEATFDKIKGHPEELAAAIFSKSNSEFEIKCKINIPINYIPDQVLKLRETNPNYEYQKTVNDFVSDPEIHNVIIENWTEEYGETIKNSLEEKNYFFETRLSDNIKKFILLFVHKNEKEYRYISIDLKIKKDIPDDYFFILLENNFKEYNFQNNYIAEGPSF
ncbi:8500_t:CDS:2 [Scutellospora calospora]|uniref:8500_t:CDS:1 n=1 Tax=Scutellospora calospora TaxID=85575 RepID=A0ACA9LDE4_9GLOM|nr:8500_t:CDS:2 [Scutellospora calospora]